jgi:hypothetical protein
MSPFPSFLVMVDFTGVNRWRAWNFLRALSLDEDWDGEVS